jgi:hypothetical protein
VKAIYVRFGYGKKHSIIWKVSAYLVVPAAGPGHMSLGLFFVVGVEERRYVDVSEQVAQPRARGQVVHSLCRTFLPVTPGQPAICPTFRAALSMSVLVVG